MVEAVSLGEVVVEGGKWWGEAGCQEEEAGMGTKMYWAEGAEGAQEDEKEVLGQWDCKSLDENNNVVAVRLFNTTE